MLSKDTQLCISMSGRPSNIGTRFHNRLYDELGLDFVYKAFSPVDLAQAVAGTREVLHALERTIPAGASATWPPSPR